MKNYALIKTKNNNHYFFSDHYNHFFLIQPIMFDLLKSIDNGIDIKKLLSSNGNYVKINSNIYQKKDIHFYYKKILYFEKNKFFDRSPIKLGYKYTRRSIISEMITRPNVTFETTTDCNLKCEYCAYGEYYDNYGERNSEYLDFNKAKKVIDYILKLCLKYSVDMIIEINVGFYGGEPLLNFDFIKKVVNYTKSLTTDRIRFKFSMTTNGVLLSKYMQFLYDNDFIMLISLDGDKKANFYRKFHNNRSSYNIVYRNIKELQEKYPDYFNKQVAINSVQHNKNSTGEMLNYFNKEFSKDPQLNLLSEIGVAKEKISSFKDTFYNNPVKKSNRFRNLEVERNETLKSEDLGFFYENINKYKYSSYSSLLFPEKGNTKLRPTSTCEPFHKRLFITTNGEIYLCEKVGRNNLFGFVNEEEVHINFKGIKELYANLFNEIFNTCKNCFRFTNCHLCVFELVDNDNKINPCNEHINKAGYSEYLLSYLEHMEKLPDNYLKSINEFLNV